MSDIEKMISIENLTFLLIVITAFYAWVTFKILKANEGVLQQMHLQQEMLYRPYISVAPISFPEKGIFYLKIENSGKTGAKNLTLQINKDFYQYAEKKEQNNLRNLHAFSSKTASLSSGEKIFFALGSGFHILGPDANQDLTPSVFTIAAVYEYGDKKVEEESTIDLRAYVKSVVPPDSTVSQLKGIKDAVTKNISELNGIKSAIIKKTSNDS